MTTYKFQATATEGSIENPANWDETPDNVFWALKSAKDKYINSLFPMPSEWSEEKCREELEAARNRAYTIKVSNKTAKTIGGAVVEFADIEIAIND